MRKTSNIESSRNKKLVFSDSEWRRVYYNEAMGGFVATHVLKDDDNLTVPGIKAEADACITLANWGKKVFRLPENVFNLIDKITLNGINYRELLKFKTNCKEPQGYPDVFFDNQTWDFKKSEYHNANSIRKLILDGRKADNVVFIIENKGQLDMISEALTREIGSRRKKGRSNELPNVYYLWGRELVCLWGK